MIFPKFCFWGAGGRALFDPRRAEDVWVSTLGVSKLHPSFTDSEADLGGDASGEIGEFGAGEDPE